MALTEDQLTELNTEITSDPEALGYAGKTNPEIATLMNAIGSATIDKEILDGQELNSVVVVSEYIALSAAKQRAWTTILSAGNGEIDVSDAGIRAQVAAIWGAGTATRAALLTLQERNCSRAETLFGLDAVITHSDIAKAVLYYG